MMFSRYVVCILFFFRLFVFRGRSWFRINTWNLVYVEVFWELNRIGCWENMEILGILEISEGRMDSLIEGKIV